MRKLHSLWVLALIAVMFIFGMPAKSHAFAEWHELQLEYVYGTKYEGLSKSINPEDGYMGSDTTAMSTFTIDYANGWKYGATVFFVDIFFEESSDEVNFYTKGWEYLSLNKIFNTKMFSMGPIKDIRLAPGWLFGNVADTYAGDVAQGLLDAGAWPGMKPVYEAHDNKSLFYGIDIDLDIPGFEFVGVTLGIYDDFNNESKYDNQFFAMLAARSRLDIGPTEWKAEGFIEYYGKRDSNAGALDQQSNLWSQIQIMLDVGQLLWHKANQFYIGTEIQWSINTFGLEDVHDGFGFVTKEQNEFFPTLLVEWVF